MTLELKNIGMIKQAKVNIDGLTVIAGENDTGKSTVGKVLYSCMKSLYTLKPIDQKDKDPRSSIIDKYIQTLFSNQISDKGDIRLFDKNKSLAIEIRNNRCYSYKTTSNYIDYPIYNIPLLIETPILWSFFPLIKTVRNIKLESFLNNIDFQVPPIFEDLYFALTTKMHESKKISLKIEKIIGGSFKENSVGDYKFYKNGLGIELTNTAMGIKLFGMLQILHTNNHFKKDQVLILDEPEVHLHPKWQLEMAKVIVDLVQNGVKIIVNSHSPYMIEALKRYSDRANLEKQTNFYLAHDGKIEQIEGSNSQTLVEIYEKLSEPYDVFEDMESERFQNG